MTSMVLLRTPYIGTGTYTHVLHLLVDDGQDALHHILGVMVRYAVWWHSVLLPTCLGAAMVVASTWPLGSATYSVYRYGYA